MITSAGIMLVSSSPIMKSDESGPIRGSAIFGRFITADRATWMGVGGVPDVAVFPAATYDHPSQLRTAVVELQHTNLPVTTNYNRDYLYSHKVLPDVTGKPALVVEARIARTVSDLGQRAVELTSLFLLLSIAVLVLAACSISRDPQAGPASDGE